MGAKYKEVGGGPAVGVANDWAAMLQSLLRGGSTPGTQMANAPNAMARILQEILSPGAGEIGGNFASQIERGIGRERGALRSRFSSIGGGFGSGAAQAEAAFGAEAADRIPMNIANLQLSTIMPLLQLIQGFSSRGVSQRGTVAEPNPWLEGFKALAGGASGAASLFGGGRQPGMPSAFGNETLSRYGIGDYFVPPTLSNFSGFNLPQPGRDF